MTFCASKRPRILRLLPGVVILGISLLALKTPGLIHGAYAQEGEKPAAKMAAADAPASASADSAEAADDEIASAAEVNVLTSLSKRRAELDGRERQLSMQANILAAAEKRVDGKIAQLKQLQDAIAKLLVQRDGEQQKQVAALVKTYSAMKPKDAARIFNSLSEDVLVPVAQDMKSDVLAPILASMESTTAQKLTVKLASRLTVPDMAPPPPPTVAPPPAAAPGPSASAAPATPAADAPASAPAAKPKS